MSLFRFQSTHYVPGFRLLFLVAFLGAAVGALAESTPTSSFEGVRYIHKETSDPGPFDIHLVEIDLSNPHIHFLVTPSNGEAPRDTNTESTSAFVSRSKAQIGVNTNFFLFDKKPQTHVSGLAFSKGEKVSGWGKGAYTDAVNIASDNTVTFLERGSKEAGDTATTPPVKLYNAVCGDQRLLRDGVDLTKGEGPRHPRTAIACTKDKKLLLLVVDGRQPRWSIGMTRKELATTLLEFGAVDAINLDGGGSSTLIFADPDPRLVNVPMPFELPASLSQRPTGFERPVGLNLAVFAKPVVISE